MSPLGDYPHERDNEPPLDKVAKKHNYNPGHILHAYFRKWKGGLDDVGPLSRCHYIDGCNQSEQHT